MHHVTTQGARFPQDLPIPDGHYGMLWDGGLVGCLVAVRVDIRKVQLPTGEACDLRGYQAMLFSSWAIAAVQNQC